MPPAEYEAALKRIAAMMRADWDSKSLGDVSDHALKACAMVAAELIGSARDWVEFEVEILGAAAEGQMKLSQVTVDWNSVAPEKPIERVKPLVTIISPSDLEAKERALRRVHPEHPFRKGLPGTGEPVSDGT